MRFFASRCNHRISRPAQLEPGIIQILRIVAVAFLFVQPLARRGFGFWIGAGAPLEVNLLLTVPPALFLLALVLIPWFPQHLGRAFLPLTLVVASLFPILDKFITLNYYITPDTFEIVALGLFLRIWYLFQVVTFIVAWQYSMRTVLIVGIGLTCLDTVLTLPFVMYGSNLYTFFVGLVATRLIIVTGISLCVSWLMQRQRAQRTELQQANQKLALASTTTEQLAISHERNRLARELHDTLAHSLSAVSVQLEAVNALWDLEPESARKILEQANTSARSGLTEARRALHSLRASPLEDLGLTLAISSLAESVANRANLQLELALPANIEGLQPQVEQCIYRVAQEALENVTRHARATNVRVALEKQNEHYALTVADNGTGFDPIRQNAGHFGIKGMQERAEMANGKLYVESAPQQGTRVRLEINN